MEGDSFREMMLIAKIFFINDYFIPSEVANTYLPVVLGQFFSIHISEIKALPICSITQMVSFISSEDLCRACVSAFSLRLLASCR